MKTIFLSLILMLVFGSVLQTNAQTAERVVLRVGKQKKLSRSKLTIKFVSLVEDSRCPEGANCIWAGNASIKVKVSNARGESKIFTLNTNTGAKGDTLGGYQFNLESLTPHPKTNIRINPSGYTATFSVTKLSR
jgi:Zn finger protein HypA/HybF involved in hydrogenase expression